MKTKTYVLFFVVLMMAACQPKTETEPVDIAAAEEAVSLKLDNFHVSIKAGNANDMMALLDNEGLYCGTDPIELWDKESLSNLMTESMADSSFSLDYSIENRKIRIAADGYTAIVLEQYTMNVLSEKMPVRFVSHLVKTDENWMIDFISWSFIPKNEDIATLNKALEQ